MKIAALYGQVNGVLEKWMHRYFLSRLTDVAEIVDLQKNPSLSLSHNPSVRVLSKDAAKISIPHKHLNTPAVSTTRSKIHDPIFKSQSINTVLLTGDNEGRAKAINEQCKFDQVYAELLPNDKVQKIQALQAKGEVVGRVGDGINDSPRLATANLGIAMGSDAAIETADIALMSDDIEKIHWLIAHSKRVLGIIKQNISFELIVKFCFILRALNELATLWIAIGADIGASLLVIFNGLRLLKIKFKKSNTNITQVVE